MSDGAGAPRANNSDNNNILPKSPSMKQEDQKAEKTANSNNNSDSNKLNVASTNKDLKSAKADTSIGDTEDETVSESEYATEEEESKQSVGYILPAKFIKSKYRNKSDNKNVAVLTTATTTATTATEMVTAPSSSGSDSNMKVQANENNGQSPIPEKKTFKINSGLTNSGVTKLTFKNKPQQQQSYGNKPNSRSNSVPAAASDNVSKNKKIETTDYDTISDYETETDTEHSDVDGSYHVNSTMTAPFLSPIMLKTPKAIPAHSNDNLNTVKLLKQNFFKLTPGRESNSGSNSFSNSTYLTPLKFSSFTPFGKKSSADQETQVDSTDSDTEMTNDNNGSPLVNRVRSRNKSKGTKKPKLDKLLNKSGGDDSVDESVKKENPFIEYGSPVNGYKLLGKKKSVNINLFGSKPAASTSNTPFEKISDPYKLRNESVEKAEAHKSTRNRSDPLQDKYASSKATSKSSVNSPSQSQSQSAGQDYEAYTKNWSQLITSKQVFWPNVENSFDKITHDSVKQFLKDGSRIILENEFKDKLLSDKDYNSILHKIYKNVLKNERIRWHPDKMVRILSNVGLLNPDAIKEEASENTNDGKDVASLTEKTVADEKGTSGVDVSAPVNSDKQYQNFSANDKLLISQITSTFQIINHVYESLSVSLQ